MFEPVSGTQAPARPEMDCSVARRRDKMVRRILNGIRVKPGKIVGNTGFHCKKPQPCLVILWRKRILTRIIPYRNSDYHRWNVERGPGFDRRPCGPQREHQDHQCP